VNRACIALAAILLLVASCTRHRARYEITGSARQVSIVYLDSTGAEATDAAVLLPWSYEFSCDSPRTLMVRASWTVGTVADVAIYVDDVLRQTGTTIDDRTIEARCTWP